MVKQRKGKCTETLRSTTRTNGSRAKSLRRSPRLSNSPAAADGAPVKKRPELKSKSKALSLHVIGDDRVEDSPLPLKMYGPDAAAAADKSRRRSAMFCGQNAGRSQLSSVKSVKLLPALSHQGMGEASKRCLRRSPRLSPNLKGSGAALGWDVIEWRESSTKRRHCGENDGTRGEGVRCLRSRTVLLHGASSEPPLKKLKRLSLDSVDSKSSNVDVKYELLALPEPPKRKPNSSKEPCKKAKTASEESDWSVSVGRCLRSRTLPIQPAGTEENGESKSALSELLNVSEDKKPIAKVETAFGSVPFGLAGSEKVETESVSVEVLHGSGDKKQPKETKAVAGSCDSSVSVGRCLRSRIIPFHRVWSESEDAKFEISADQSQLKRTSSKKKGSEENGMCCFVGEPVPEEEAQERWRWRYELKSQGSKSKSWKLNAGEEDEIILNVKCHYTQANVGSCIFNLGDCAYIKGDGRQKYVGRIVEFFKTTDGEDYFRVQWFFRAEDTVMKDAAASHDKKRLFHSNLMNDNLLDCIVSKVSVIHIAPSLGLEVKSIPSGAFYYDMEYCVEYSTFRMLSNDNFAGSRDLSTPDDIEAFHSLITATPLKDLHSKAYKAELALLDLYSGCGGMSTGLCLGTKLSGVNLVTRWAVDADSSACDSLKLNHPTTQIRNETAEDFLELLKAWDKLCQWYVFNNLDRTLKSRAEETREVKSKNFASGLKIPAGEFEVLRLVDICFGDPCNTGKRGLKFKVRWMGYSSSEDTWEPIEGLSNCQERIGDFVRTGFKSKMLPLPGDVDVLCGGPPCQGISGYNRFRNTNAPLEDERNRQIIIFMDIVEFLRPKYVLMENVVDILRFDKGSLGRYALSRLVHMRYQARLGIMAAGCYGLPQFRLRVFLWGTLPGEKLPQFPLPTHDVVVRYWPPSEFEQNTVAYDEGEHCHLEEAVVLRDAISDLPAVPSHEVGEEMTYKKPPNTEFQRYMRLTKDEMMGFARKGTEDAKKLILYDHRPHPLSEDDYIRVCKIPHRKGANFRDLPGLIVGQDNAVRRDPKVKQMMLPSGKPMIPDYVFTFEQGKSKRPFARVWWDETVATIVTFPNCHNQAALHPEQDRIFTIREYARLQGFPDFYRFKGTVKERYCQVGNAVAVPVARALGYALGMAIRKLAGNEPLMTLPPKFAFQLVPVD